MGVIDVARIIGAAAIFLAEYFIYGGWGVVMLMKAGVKSAFTTSIEPTVAYNLAIPMFFALTIGGAYTIVYNLAEGTRRRLSLGQKHEYIGESPPHPRLPPQGEGTNFRPLWGRIKEGASPVFAGIGGALFVAVLGNLDGAIQLGHGLKRVLLFGEPFGAFDFWRSSRMMPPDPPGLEITEFPFFSFLFADLHAHMMVIPFTLLALGVSLAVVLGASHMRRPGSWGAIDVASLPWRRKADGLRLPERCASIKLYAALRPLVWRRLHQLLLLGAVPHGHDDTRHVYCAHCCL